MARYAVIDEATDEILNVAVWDTWGDVPEIEGVRIVEDGSAQWDIGGTLTVGLVYTPPTYPEPEE